MLHRTLRLLLARGVAAAALSRRPTPISVANGSDSTLSSSVELAHPHPTRWAVSPEQQRLPEVQSTPQIQFRSSLISLQAASNAGCGPLGSRPFAAIVSVPILYTKCRH
ncbi:uncharacterized protein BKA55DRAFT_540192 [Fusarium redolens]|uniref:Secreted protein n=1 Tax=Fusarium redolens TaxID=48865 RepID=A0A9P9H1S6_FUSRE|nr:uncharacterized protein BKA55DRAFT_540192 [Fusarium redolens]KAH7248768.1 hypothetical protein BKA55DRAFT_540192 [Fusarium redolens]